jgi:hypothetical protein
MNAALLRSAIIVAALILWFWTQKLIARKSNSGEGIGDGIHRLTARWHGYFLTNESSANRALAVSSFLIDLLGISLIVMAIFGPSFAPFLGLLIVFGLRQLCQLCCTLPPPPGLIWRDPGVPSALVTYGVSNDFFFSGHTALAVLGALELCQLAPWWVAALAVWTSLPEPLPPGSPLTSPHTSARGWMLC